MHAIKMVAFTALSMLFLINDRVAAYMDIIQELKAKLEPSRHKRQTPIIAPGFDAALQRIDVSGPHEFVPPGPGDQRGPCPGLNALANHNYLPHNGVATIRQFTEATNRVFGMGFDISLFLSVYGAIFDGNLEKWSIGGPSDEVELPAFLSQPQGISYSHNHYEGDASPTRGDLYLCGEAYLLKLCQFKQLYFMQNNTPDANYNIPIIRIFEEIRLNHSISTNPYFFYGFVSGFGVANGAHHFIYRFFANKSAEFPEGKLDRYVLKTFFAISGDDDNLIYTPGHERIPENWYRRALDDEYTLPLFFGDLIATGLVNPQTLALGGNTGTVNSFTGVNVADLTGGVYNARTLFESNNLACFLVQSIQMVVPSFFKGPLIALSSVLLNLFKGINGSGLTLDNCPQLTRYNESVFSIYPGYTKYANGTYPTFGNCTC